MRILITGICGFVGSTIARELREQYSTAEIVGLDNLVRAGSETNRMSLATGGARVYHGDIRLASDVDSLPVVDWVVDASANPSVLAGTDGKSSPRQVVEHNLLGTLNLLEYCRRNRAGFVMLSTSRVYSIRALSQLPILTEGNRFVLAANATLPAGVNARGLTESFSTEAPVSLYGATKLASEQLALEYRDAFEVPVWINRCGVLAGAGQFGRADQGIIAYWINAWIRGVPLTYLGFGGKGEQVRDALHPRDLVSLLLRQMDPATKFGADESPVFNLAGGLKNAFSLASLSEWCSARYGPRPVLADPTIRRFDIPWLVLDAARASLTWDWPVKTSLESIFLETAQHAEVHPEWLTVSGSMT
ncbi:CDP-tyvelose epimerase [Verrucomicrobia bacterium SCGC AG-212-E04]|nr:CDP-tyvelose epimerase [Verrucomicrobia bacterium SCGC AG-212-E04]